MEVQSQTYMLIGISWFGMLALFAVVAYLYLNYRKKILKNEAEKQMAIFSAAADLSEKQRQEFANNLHDEVMALTSGVISGIDSSIRAYSENKFEISNLERVKEIAIQINNSARNISLELMPAVLIELGFVKALSRHLERMNDSNCKVKFINKTPFDIELPVEKNLEVHIYRICLEILNNLKKHDRFSYLEMSLSTKGSNLIILFSHDGRGVTNEQMEYFSDSPTGLGLKSLNSRLLILGGKITYLVEESGPKIELILPFSL